MFARLFAWLRRHQRFVDLMLMLPVAVAAWVDHPRYVESPTKNAPKLLPFISHSIPFAGHVALVVAFCLPLIWRRRWPRLVFTIVALVAFVQWLSDVTITASDLAVMVGMYTVAAECAFRWALAAVVVAELGGIMAILSMARGQRNHDVWNALLPFSVFIGATWLCGLYISTRRKYTLSLEERARRLERERDAQAEVAAAAERARIARELHDVIAHSISVMVVQADGASYMINSDAERARHAMEAIGSTGRQALMEMRRMLGLLREDDREATLAPQPGIDQLTELVEQVRSAGLPVELNVSGSSGPLPAGLQLAIYRIVQEALTNVLKHAGPVATASVRLDYGQQTIKVQVRDDGRGATSADGRGHGLVGMRERAAVYGGDVRAEPVPGGGFQVLARLPVKEGVKA